MSEVMAHSIPKPAVLWSIRLIQVVYTDSRDLNTYHYNHAA
ncbi:MAG: hypothetical protein RL701_2643 [Pseudomonadota bacterium]|jgi:hypothetical protein